MYFQVFSQENGPAHAIWRNISVPLTVNTADKDMKFAVDWLKYEFYTSSVFLLLKYLKCMSMAIDELELDSDVSKIIFCSFPG